MLEDTGWRASRSSGQSCWDRGHCLPQPPLHSPQARGDHGTRCSPGCAPLGEQRRRSEVRFAGKTRSAQSRWDLGDGRRGIRSGGGGGAGAPRWMGQGGNGEPGQPFLEALWPKGTRGGAESGKERAESLLRQENEAGRGDLQEPALEGARGWDGLGEGVGTVGAGQRTDSPGSHMTDCTQDRQTARPGCPVRGGADSGGGDSPGPWDRGSCPGGGGTRETESVRWLSQRELREGTGELGDAVSSFPGAAVTKPRNPA